MQLDAAFVRLVPLLLVTPSAAAQICVPELQELRASDGEDGDDFGSAVAVDGDVAAIGAPFDDDVGADVGAVYLFGRGGAGWTQLSKLLPTGAASRFGASVALSDDTLVVGAHGDGAGTAFVFVRQGGTWPLQAQLHVPPGSHATYFGYSVAIDGDRVAVGAPALNLVSHPGEVHVFVRQGSTWTLEASLVDPTTGGLWPREFGSAVDVQGDVLAVGVPQAHLTGNFSGAVAVYRRTGTSWVQEDLLVPQGAHYKSYFGTAVAIESERIAGGAPETVYGGTGTATVFERISGAWIEKAVIAPSSVTGGAQFGAAIALSGEALLVGAWRDSPVGLASGSGFLYRLVGSKWTELAKLQPADGGMSSEEYGRSVALDGETALVGRPYARDVGVARGTAHVAFAPAPVGVSSCFCGAGPCGNSDPAAGCANSTGSGGSFVAVGDTNLDLVSFLVTGAVPKQFAAFFQADASVAPFPFGDGLSCAGGNLVALNPLPRQIGFSGVLVFGACGGDPSISLLGGVTPGSGTTRSYQLWYRDPNGPCGHHFDLTNAVEIVW